MFGYGTAPEVYLPLSKSLVPDLGTPGSSVVQLVGRLRDDQTLADGRAAFAAAAGRADAMMASPADTGFARVELFSPARGLSQGGAPGAVAAFLAVLLVIVAPDPVHRVRERRRPAARQKRRATSRDRPPPRARRGPSSAR